MSFAIHFKPAVMSTATYDEIIRRLIAAGAGHPSGREYHVCFGDPNSLQVIDVWTSMEAFQRFAETLIPTLQRLGIDPGQPDVFPAHHVIVPTAAAV